LVDVFVEESQGFDELLLDHRFDSIYI
jgi:hypothetical protein